MLSDELKGLAKVIKEAVFDIETDGLIHEYKNVWCICVENVEDGRILTFHDYPTFTGSHNHYTKEEHIPFDIPKRDGTLEDGAKFLHIAGNNDGLLICHNVIGFDKKVLEDNFPRYEVPLSNYRDTLLQSQVQLYDRTPVKGCKGVHGLDPWGSRVGIGKPKVVDYKEMTPWLLFRCIEDIRINTKTYQALEIERLALLEDFGLDSLSPLETEGKYAIEALEQEITGCLVDKPHMLECVKDLDKKIEKLRKEVEPQLPLYLKIANGKKETAKYVAEKIGSKTIPKLKYKMEEDPETGEMVKKYVKNWFVPTDYIWKVEKRNSYEVTYKEKPTGVYFDKLQKAREYIKEKVTEGGIKKDYSTIKSVNEFKIPNLNTCKYFDMSEEECSKILGGVFTKVEVLRPVMTQHEKVKEFLISLGWKPLEYNYKKIKKKLVRDNKGQLIKTTPKLTEESYVTLPEGVGQSIAQYNTYIHRRRYLENAKDDEKGLLNMIREDGRLSAGIRTFGTATGRGVQTVIVNLPSPKALYGDNMRKCVVAKKGYVLVGCDMAGAQLRLSADFAGNIEYGEALIKGNESHFVDGKEVYLGTDAHTINCIGFGLATEEQRDEASRTQDPVLIHQMSIARGNGKNGTYAVIFGCSGKKLAIMIKVDESTGEDRKKAFFDKLGLTGLIAKLVKEWKSHKRGRGGYIKTLGGYFVYCSSEHKVLNYFIQGAEAIIQRHAVLIAKKKIDEEKLDSKLILNYHDEVLHETLKKDAERVGLILNEAYSEAAKELGVTIEFGGDAKIGQSYYEVH